MKLIFYSQCLLLQIIYLTRNVKDVILSFFHHYRNIVGYKGSLDDFIYCFMNSQIIYAPFFDHILDFWAIKDNPNILFLFYEDMKADLMPIIEKVSGFLGKSYTEKQLTELANHLSVENMRSMFRFHYKLCIKKLYCFFHLENPSCNHEHMLNLIRKYNDTCKDPDYSFIRKGKVGAFKEEMTLEQIKLIDEWTKKCLHGSDFPYRY